MNWKKALCLMVMVLFVVGAVGCGGSPEKPKADEKKPIKIVFWYSVGGKVAESTKVLVDRFNSSQKEVFVEAIFQGSYDDAINKLKQSIVSKAAPHVMQVYDIGSRFMIDSKAVVPVQKWVDADKMDLKAFEPNLLAYYTVDNKLYSMPFNTSTPILYYNKNMFKDAGLDPAKPPQTFEEVVAAARKLTVKDNSGKVTRPGITIAIYGWFFEQLMAVQNAFYANNENGRSGMATATAFNSPEGEKILTWWQGMVKEGIAGNIGRLTANTQKAFIGGQTAMTIDSTGVLGDIVTGVGGKFEVGTAFLPRPEGAKGGVIIGGGSMWMLSGHPDAEEKAAWTFIKFMSDAKQQAYWHINTGYFPVTMKAYDDADLKAHHAKYPQFKVAVDQLHSTPITKATQGALLGVFTQSRQEIETAIETVLNNQATPKEALTKTAGIVDAALTRYNQTAK